MVTKKFPTFCSSNFEIRDYVNNEFLVSTSSTESQTEIIYLYELHVFKCISHACCGLLNHSKESETSTSDEKRIQKRVSIERSEYEENVT